MDEGRAFRLKNRPPDSIQATAEQLLRDARNQKEYVDFAPKQRIQDMDEHHDRKRKEFEERIRRAPSSLYENTILSVRRIQYQEELAQDGYNYDVWFDYIRLEECTWQDLKADGATQQGLQAASERVREVYKRAIAQVPLEHEKKYWRRYIFLWLNYALYEEIEMEDFIRTRQVYQMAIQAIPHKTFTFAKLWLTFAKFEIRRLDVGAARKTLGTAIRMCPKPALFKGYIGLEIDLREFERVRKLYEKYIEFNPNNTSAWIDFASLEAQLGDIVRARAIFELSLSAELDLLQHVHKSLFMAYINFETQEGERERARALYERLLAFLCKGAASPSGIWKVWAAYAAFEAGPVPVPQVGEDGMGALEEEEDKEEVKHLPGDPAVAMKVFERGYEALKGVRKESVALLEEWKKFENEHGTPQGITNAESLIDLDRNSDDEHHAPMSKFMQAARLWKETQT